MVSSVLFYCLPGTVFDNKQRLLGVQEVVDVYTNIFSFYVRDSPLLEDQLYLTTTTLIFRGWCELCIIWCIVIVCISLTLISHEFQMEARQKIEVASLTMVALLLLTLHPVAQSSHIKVMMHACLRFLNYVCPRLFGAF